MSETEYNPENDPEDAGSTDEEIADALADADYIDAEGSASDSAPEADSAESDADSGGLSGKLSRLTELSGSGKSLEAYEDDPIASVFDTDGGDGTHKGAKHIARGVDGLSPLAATNPLVDIGVGFVLLAADDETDGGLFGGGGDDPDNPDSDVSAREAEDGGEMLT